MDLNTSATEVIERHLLCTWPGWVNTLPCSITLGLEATFFKDLRVGQSVLLNLPSAKSVR